MLASFQQGHITQEEYDQHKRTLILALSKPILGSQHAASAPSRLALLTELKNRGCILDIEYQWARVPIVCQVDLARRPRKENRPPVGRGSGTEGGAKQSRGDRTGHHPYGGPLQNRGSNGSSAPPLQPSKYGPNIEHAAEHPLAPGTKEAFLLHRASLSGEGSEFVKGRRIKRQPSFAGLGHARRSASFSAGESSASEACTSAKKDLRSSLSFGSAPTPDGQRKTFRRSLSFGGRTTPTPDPSPREYGPPSRPTDPPVSLRLPPLAQRAPHARRLSLLEAATGLVRNPKEFATPEQGATDSEQTRTARRHRKETSQLKTLQVVESEPEPSTSKPRSWASKNKQSAQKSGSFGSAEDFRSGEQRRNLLQRGGWRGEGAGSGTSGSGFESGRLETSEGVPRVNDRRRSAYSSGEEGFWRRGTGSSATEWESGAETRRKEHGASAQSLSGRTARGYSTESGLESEDGLPRGSRAARRKGTVEKVARQLLENGHVLLKDWNKKGMKLVGLVKVDKGARSRGGSCATTDDDGDLNDVKQGFGACDLKDAPSRNTFLSGSKLQTAKRRVQSTLDTWRREACGPQPPEHFLTNGQIELLAELLPQTADDLTPVLSSSWTHRHGPYVLTIVRDALTAGQVPTRQPPVVTSASAPPRRPAPPLPSASINPPEAVPSVSEQSARSYGTWARKGRRSKHPPCDAEKACPPRVTAESDEDLDVFSPGVGSLPPERVGNPRAGHANRQDYLRRSQEKVLRRSLDAISRTSPVKTTLNL
ncbi:hypothetical protein KFL_008740030 [Klebsormidium nitens]|uniref:Uncharacterized protein n=1 Tax=Klebsormidium nitens TaxID=105231 RepID=A0A1Y1ILZ0_KLENI|nr:hypothetical protein KFL_008740030 [Klebsormidium nitens]|eukprot:GAQ91880.1 hypothetical protein KFL_008740030 [Klebsormidium nitens]